MYNVFYSAIEWSWELIKRVKFSVILVPDSCRATDRNGNSISADVTEDTNENDYDNACFSYFKQFGSCFGLFDIEG